MLINQSPLTVKQMKKDKLLKDFKKYEVEKQLNKKIMGGAGTETETCTSFGGKADDYKDCDNEL